MNDTPPTPEPADYESPAKPSPATAAEAGSPDDSANIPPASISVAPRAPFVLWLSLACMALGLTWGILVLTVGLPNHATLRRYAPKIKKRFDGRNDFPGTVIGKIPEISISHETAAFLGVIDPLTAFLGAAALCLIGLAGLVRLPFLSITAAIYLSLWTFGVMFSRPPPAVTAEQITPSKNSIALTTESDAAQRKNTARFRRKATGQVLVEFGVGLAVVIGTILLHRFMVHGTMRYVRSKRRKKHPSSPPPVSTEITSLVTGLKEGHAPPNTPETQEPVIRCSQLTRQFQDGEKVRKVLNGLNLEVRSGEIVAILGQSGSGKSTLLHLIGQLDSPTSGRIFINGEDTLSLPQSRRDRLRNETVGFVFQFFHLMPEFDVLDNVLMPARIGHAVSEQTRDNAEGILTLLGLLERKNQSVTTLSGGERQRVAIARALINNPSILLCDEPTGNLDEATGDELINQLLALRDRVGLTIVVVTHDTTLAAKADTMYILEKGKLEKKPHHADAGVAAGQPHKGIPDERIVADAHPSTNRDD